MQSNCPKKQSDDEAETDDSEEEIGDINGKFIKQWSTVKTIKNSYP